MSPWYIRAILVRPDRVVTNLERVTSSPHICAPAPTEWQLCLGVLRLWHRLVFRSETVGTCRSAPVRTTLRARLLAWRALRLPFLLRERAVMPLDFTGLASPPEAIIRHLIAAHHEHDQLVYDLEILGHYGMLEQLRDEVRAVVESDGPHARWLRDLAVFDGYHEALLAAVERAISAGPGGLSAQEDPDLSLIGYLRWCAAQPASPRATIRAWRAGTFRLDSPLESA